MHETLNFVIRELQRHKGQWPKLERESGVSKRTFEKIANGHVRNPRIDTIERLAAYLRSKVA